MTRIAAPSIWSGILFLGGEALQGALLKDLRQVTAATIENMYGPTETTIWSSTGPALPTDGNVPLGTPIANTQLYVLDDKLRPQPVGLPGELFIGGDGVTRGYYKREDLTRERFLANPFVEGGRMYRTGDLVRIARDGAVQFLGRSDFQVKVRGYRIELGEIESLSRACILAWVKPSSWRAKTFAMMSASSLTCASRRPKSLTRRCGPIYGRRCRSSWCPRISWRWSSFR